MRIAIPIHGNRVMPRFGCTREILIADIEDGNVLATKLIAAGIQAVHRLLATERVSILICGGIHPRFQQVLQEQNIEIIWGVVGEWQEVLQAYLRGTLQHDKTVCSVRRAGEGRHLRQRHQGRR
jgi:predicted Fe-Mo cluster-binding NifX family protein